MKINEVITEGPLTWLDKPGARQLQAMKLRDQLAKTKMPPAKPLLTRGAGGGPGDWRAEDGPKGKGPRAKLTPRSQELLRNQDIKMGRSKGMRTPGGGSKGPPTWLDKPGARQLQAMKLKDMLAKSKRPEAKPRLTRGYGGKFGGTLGVLPALGGTIAARKRAKEYTGKEDPSFMDTMKMMYPVLGKPKKKFGLNPGDA